MTDGNHASPETSKLRQEIQAFRQETDVAERQTTADFSVRKRSQVRAHVTRVLVYFFVAYLALVAGLVLFGAAGDGSSLSLWKEKADFLVEVLKAGILPVITFVLGHYFGSEGK